jgi:hypothetical protein
MLCAVVPLVCLFCIVVSMKMVSKWSRENVAFLKKFMYIPGYPKLGGSLYCSWLRHCATSRNVAVAIPSEVFEIFDLVFPAALWSWGPLRL